MYAWIYPDQLPDLLRRNTAPFAANSSCSYLNTPISFDIETSSFYQLGDKCACMYIWQLDIFDTTVIGRTWDEFVWCLDQIAEHYQLNKKKRVLIYVHNLAYEFQFMRKWLQWKQVFSIRERKPLYALTSSWIEFRCSYLLTGMALEDLGLSLGKPIEKLDTLDYHILRHPASEISDDELQYCIHDVKIVSQCIRERIAEESGICFIPYTKTGYVRRLCRHVCTAGKQGTGYRCMISELTIEPEEYAIARKVFAGGYTHANFWHVRETIEDVDSFDFASSYPAVMVSELFPMSKGTHVERMSRREFEMYCKKYLCIFTIELHDVQSICDADDYLSESKCELIEDCIINNGRVHRASRLITSMTNIDLQVMMRCYTFKIKAFSNFWYYLPRPLPTVFVSIIMDLYKKKTALKGVKGKEKEYGAAKENINSMYGMCVTDIVRELCEYKCDDNEWDMDPETLEEYRERLSTEIARENRKKGRFLFYLWGVFVTSYARRNIWKGIQACGSDYLYSDTDSIKIMHAERHLDFIEDYNKKITEKIRRALKGHGLDPDLAAPKTRKGKRKPLGIFEHDGHYARFKTLGAKRYLYEITESDDPDEIGLHLTCAGLHKIKACEYIADQPEPFEFFRDNMYIPPGCTGKLTHTFIDREIRRRVEDKNHVPYTIHEKSFIHLEGAEYKLRLAQEFKNFLNGIHVIDFY